MAKRSAYEEAREVSEKHTPGKYYPGYKDIQARGGFNAPPATIDFNSIGNFLSGVGSNIGGAVSSIINRFNQPAVYRTDFRQPVVSPTASPSPQEFKFKMGQNNYQWAKPQIQRLLQEKQSPLLPYVNEFVSAGEQYGVDPRILPAIAGVESSYGKSYPPQSFNPFGYIWLRGKSPQNYQEIVQGLYGAGFSSLPHAIDRLTYRFIKSGTPQGYTNFRVNPTLKLLQQAYNANPAEHTNYLNLLNEIVQYYQ